MSKISDLSNEELFDKYYYLVKIIANHYQKYSRQFEDLVQEGSIGLLEAKAHFDEDKGAQFQTYASFWIKKRILSILDKEIKENHHLEFNDAIELIDTNLSITEKENHGENINFSFDLPKLEELILKRSFEEKKSLNDIAGEFGISREKARQFKQKAMRRYKSEMLKKETKV